MKISNSLIINKSLDPFFIFCILVEIEKIGYLGKNDYQLLSNERSLRVGLHFAFKSCMQKKDTKSKHEIGSLGEKETFDCYGGSFKVCGACDMRV